MGKKGENGYDRCFAVDPSMGRLREELVGIPRLYDSEGRLKLPPKERSAGRKSKAAPSIREIIGRSPDRADSLVLAWEGLTAPLPGAKLPPLVFEGEVIVSAPGFDNEAWNKRHPAPSRPATILDRDERRDDRDRGRRSRRVDDRR